MLTILPGSRIHLSFLMSAVSLVLLVNVTSPVDTDLSVQIRPTFFVLSSSASESCHLLMVTSSATGGSCCCRLPREESPYEESCHDDGQCRRGNSFVSFSFPKVFHVTRTPFNDSKNKISKVINHKKNSRPFVRVSYHNLTPPNPFWCETQKYGVK